MMSSITLISNKFSSLQLVNEQVGIDHLKDGKYDPSLANHEPNYGNALDWKKCNRGSSGWTRGPRLGPRCSKIIKHMQTT